MGLELCLWSSRDLQTGSLRGFAYSQKLPIAFYDLLCVMPLAFQSNSKKTQTSAFVSAQKNHCQKLTVMHVVLCESSSRCCA